MSDAQSSLIATSSLLAQAQDHERRDPDLVSQLDVLWHYACVGSPLLSAPLAKAETPALFPQSEGCRLHLLRRVFHCFDQNHDGLVSTSEISKLLRALGIPQYEDAAQSLMAGFTTKLVGYVDEHELCLLYGSVRDTLNASIVIDDEDDLCLMEAFQVFDNDGNGFISPRELQSVLCSLGFGQASQLEACVEMIARVDGNADGLVDFLEFKQLFHFESNSNLIAAS